MNHLQQLILLVFFVLLGNVHLHAQQSKSHFGVAGSYGWHTQLLNRNATSHYSPAGRFSGSVWGVFHKKGAEIALEPAISLSWVEYQYDLSEEKDWFYDEWAYLHLDLNASFAINRRKSNRLFGGLFLRLPLFSDLSVVQRDHSLLSTRFSEVLERIDREAKPDSLLAGINLGYRFTLKPMPKLGFTLSLQQDIIPIYRDDITFSYTNIFDEKKSLTLNGQPTSLLIGIRYQLL